VVTTIASAIIAGITRFPMDWAVLWGMSISTTAQLAATWVPSREREASSSPGQD